MHGRADVACDVVRIGIAVHRARTHQRGEHGLVILFPLAFVSSALVPTQRMPEELRTIADWNPVSAVAAAAREPTTLYRRRTTA